jgi:hypothetical protein
MGMARGSAQVLPPSRLARARYVVPVSATSTTVPSGAVDDRGDGHQDDGDRDGSGRTQPPGPPPVAAT